MSEIAHHLIRRAVDVTQLHQAQASTVSDGDDGLHLKKLATWGVVLLWVTGILYLAIVSAVSFLPHCDVLVCHTDVSN